MAVRFCRQGKFAEMNSLVSVLMSKCVAAYWPETMVTSTSSAMTLHLKRLHKSTIAVIVLAIGSEAFRSAFGLSGLSEGVIMRCYRQSKKPSRGLVGCQAPQNRAAPRSSALGKGACGARFVIIIS